jgi:hypothetical protein
MEESKNMIKKASKTTSHWYSGMTFLLRLLAVASASLVVCASALAAPKNSVEVRKDSVEVRMIPGGLPQTDMSAESVTVTVSRYQFQAAMPDHEIEIDRFFGEVRRILAETEAPPEWSRLPWADVPVVKLDITLDGRRFQLACIFGRPECYLPDDASAADKRVASAVQRILNLVAERVSQALGARR